jgi:hypothetical protein
MAEQIPDGDTNSLVQADGYATISADKGRIMGQDEVT